MISSIRIEGYRGLESFEMNGLGRINLLVGTNNSGKTSVLEAIYLLASMGDPAALWQVLLQRGERLLATRSISGDRAPEPFELDPSHLFTGHDARLGSVIRIAANHQPLPRTIEFAMAEAPRRDVPGVLGAGGERDPTLQPVLRVTDKGNSKQAPVLVALSWTGGVAFSAMEPAHRLHQRAITASPVRFLSAESLSADELVAMWNNIALTPTEGVVLKALQFLDGDIERIAAQTTFQATRSGFIVKRKGSEQPVPIGSMGDGMWRMLAMSIAITQCKGGTLLIDEIDTGLHYTVMSRMWTLIYDAAQEFDVQVFATTHSYDCVYSLAQIRSQIDAQNTVTVQRIEPGKKRSVPYDEEDISVAASRNIEVR